MKRSASKSLPLANYNPGYLVFIYTKNKYLIFLGFPIPIFGSFWFSVINVTSVWQCECDNMRHIALGCRKDIAYSIAWACNLRRFNLNSQSKKFVKFFTCVPLPERFSGYAPESVYICRYVYVPYTDMTQLRIAAATQRCISIFLERFWQVVIFIFLE